MSKKILLLTVFIFSVQVYSQDLLMQDGTFNQCMGTFLDSGGGSAGYSNNENFTITICPDIPGEAISINFTAFNTENNFDFLSIFDGTDDTAAPLGTFTGINSPGLVEPSDANTSGCLTFVWTSDNSIPLAGWSADISCFTPCQNIIANVDSTVPGSTSANVVVADVNDSITFNGSGTFTTGGIGATYLWDFGDGNTGLGESVNHTYTTAGFYVVTLTITDTDGCTSTNNIGLTAQIGTTSPGNPSVDAGDDIDIPCTETCTTLTASFLDIGETNTYTVTDIAFVPPFPFDGLTNNVNTNIDDAWDDVEDLPFDFCFFDNVETQFQVGSNGLIRFDVDPDDTSNYWNLQNDTLPNESNDALGEGNVFTPVHDIDPRASTGEEIAWEIIGTAPNRVLAVSFYNVQMWQCNGAIATHMAVFYETTNVIDIYIKDAPYCDRWNNNKAVGIQNDAGTQAFVPPGRNTNEGGTFTQPGWTAQDEAWRFTPAGPSIVEFAWLDDMGNVLSTDASFEVCPTDASTTYTAQVTYTNCNGDITIVTDDVTVTTNSPFTVDLGPDVNQCEGDADVNLDATTAGGTTYQWSLDGVDLVGETNPTLTVISPNSGNYLVTVTDATGCIDTDAVLINYAPIPDPSFTVTPTCDGGTVMITGDTGGTFTFNPIPTDGAVIDTATGEVTGGTSATTYTIEYTLLNICSSTSAVTFMVNPLPNDAGIPSDFLECENNTDFKFDFDLETKNSEILNGQDQTMFTVTYHDSQADADNLVDPLVSPYENISNPQLIFVAITNNMTGCSVSSQSFNIEVLNGASAFDDFYEECDVVNDNDGFTQFDLDSRSPIIMNGADPFAFSISYHFSFDDAVNDINPLPFLYENLTNPQIIYARVSNNIRPEDCFEISELTLQTNLLPIFDLDDTYTLCLTSNNEAVVSIPLVIDTELSDANYSFEWRFNGNILTTETDSSLIPTQSGTYSVLVTDTSTSTVTMCTNFDETVVVEGGIPDTFDIEVVSEIFIGNNVIIATVTGNSEYEFSLDNGPWQLSGEFENVSCGDHTVAVRDVLGCGILFKDITLIDYPKFFTPNGDGNNDTWTIKGIDSQPSAVIYIYNRFGKLLKQLSPTGPGWDGTYNGKKMPSSDYWFTLEYTEPINDEKRTFSAHFALKR